MTFKVNGVVACPPVLVPVIVYTVEPLTTVGVPVIEQFESIETPDGRAGEIVHWLVPPPVFVDVIPAPPIAVPLTSVTVFGL